MNGALLLSITVLIYFLAYRFYGKYLCRLFHINPDLRTPAHTLHDGIDYVPTKAPVLFGHHFASIAGAGPIVGPVLGACFGWVPVALWIIFGAVLIGAVHDFAALFLSIRNQGKSIGYIVEQYIGFAGRQIFLAFCLMALLLVIAIFTILVAQTFVSSPAVATSSIFFMVLAVLYGLLTYRFGVSLWTGSLIFVPLLFFGIWLGILFPLDLVMLLNLTAAQAQTFWMIFLLIYVFIASVAPVWILLQPRDYLNSYLLYLMVIIGIAGILIARPAFHLPAFAGFVVQEPSGGEGVTWALFPILYVTVACGACSGFHALVSSGTTAKQISSENHILPIGYGAMLLEGIVAMIALVSVAVLPKETFIHQLGVKGAVNTFSSGLASLTAHAGLPIKTGETFISLTISAFILTTLDTATRLTRFTLEGLFFPPEGAKPRSQKIFSFFTNRYVSASLVVLSAGYLGLHGEAGKIWPVFGASNQLLAALTLLTVTLVLVKRRVKAFIVFWPFLFMLIMSLWALIELFFINLQAMQWPLIVATSLLITIAFLMVVQSAVSVRRWRGKPVAAVPVG